MNKHLKRIVSSFVCLTLTLSTVVSFNVKATDKSNSKVFLDTSANKIKTIESENLEITLPAYYNGVEKGFVTTPKDQKSLNTCWAFTGTAMLESYLLKNNLGYYDFSEEHINLWATTRENSTGWQRSYYDAGYSKVVSGYLTSFSGGVDEKLFPYNTMSSSKYEQLEKVSPKFGVTELMYVGQDVNTVKNCVYNYGAVYANCAINSNYFSYDNTSFCINKKLDYGLLGHVVTIVGWDDNYSKDNFNPEYKPENNGAWLVKNSWGENANDNGFIWISYEDKYLLSDVFGYSYAIREAKELEDDDKLYQHDEFGATYNMNLYETINNKKVYDKNVTYINVFDFSKENRVLDEIIFESESVGGEYTAYLVPVKNDEPIQDKTLWKKLSEDIIDYSGYHSVDLNKLDLPKDKCGIALEIDTSKSGAKAGIGVSETLFNTIVKKTTFTPYVEENQGFIIRNGEMYEFLDFYKEELNDYVNVGSITIKALTSLEDILLGDVNSDNKISLEDVVYLQFYLSHIELEESKFKEDNADVNQDGKIDISDTVLIQLILAKLKN